jgi:hypothetical protein
MFSLYEINIQSQLLEQPIVQDAIAEMEKRCTLKLRFIDDVFCVHFGLYTDHDDGDAEDIEVFHQQVGTIKGLAKFLRLYFSCFERLFDDEDDAQKFSPF